MGTVETLLKPENLKTLQILTYHVVSGKMNAADIAKAIKAGNGKLHSVSGGTLTAWMKGKNYTSQMKMVRCQKSQSL
jgi:uncharacterized surface protein with fasciclin (FAS1) repeats